MPPLRFANWTLRYFESFAAGAGVEGAEPVVVPGSLFGRGVTSRTAGGGVAGFCAAMLVDAGFEAVSLLVAVDMP